MRCARCFEYLATPYDEQACAACLAFPPLPARMRFLWHYETEAREVITAMKYKPSLALCRLLGRWLGERLLDLFSFADWDLIVPLPSTRASLEKRLFNQCAVLSSEIVRVLPQILAPIEHRALRMHTEKRTQAALEPTQRIRNVRDCFQSDSARVNGKKILLIDDVITTGATCTSAVSALLTAGAHSVDVLAVARARSWNQHRQTIYRAFSAEIRMLFPEVSRLDIR